jgi:putative glutathione S-transferase
MGLLVDGVWQDQWYDTKSTGGRFVRKDSAFRKLDHRRRLSRPDWNRRLQGRGRALSSLRLARLPWAHRTLIMRKLKGLEAMIDVSAVHWRMLDHGWTFEEGPGVIPDTINRADYLYQVYTAATPDYTGRVTVPVLWDKASGAIVNNESARSSAC